MAYRTATDYRGTFVQGTTTTLFIKFTNSDGMYVDPEQISISVVNESDNEVSSGIPERIGRGGYIFDWIIPTDGVIGPYIAKWTYNDGVDDILYEQGVQIIADGDAPSNSLYAGRIAQFREQLELMIACAQCIPVKDEQGISNEAQSSYGFTFTRWNQASHTYVYLNQKMIGNGFNVDYFKGKVVFDTPLTKYDTVNVDYNFRWFSDQQLDRFLSNALGIVNLYPPETSYSLINVPDKFIPVILYGAAKDALRELLLCLQFQQPQRVFGGPDAAQKAFSNIETLKKNYEDEFKELLQQKKLGRYPGTKAVIVPEFTLPGSRSRWFRYLFNGGSG